MILKERQIPRKILAIQALLRRLPENHSKISTLQSDLAKSMAGFRGEQAVDYYMSFLPKANHFILHDIRLYNGQHYFQIDTLLLTPTCIFVIEIKNMTGTLFFDQVFHQLIRTFQEKEEGFRCPINQVKFQSNQLSDWISTHKLPEIPIQHLVVISQPSTIIRSNRPVLNRVCHASSLIESIKKHSAQYSSQSYPQNTLKKMARQLHKNHSPQELNILEQYQINPSEITLGVLCKKCEATMIYKRGLWYCSHCDTVSKDAHVAAVVDYFLLINKEMTASQFRRFVRIDSRSTASKLLAVSEFSYRGEQKGRVYYQNEG